MGLGAVLPSCTKEQVLRPKEQKLPSFSKETYVNSVCGLCPAGCGIRIRKIGDKAVGVSGIPEHPINKGGLCPKGAAILQDLYHPDRLQNPLLKDGPRGSGKWTEITWEKAISLISERTAGTKTLAPAKQPLVLTFNRAWDINGYILQQLSQILGNNNYFTYNCPVNNDNTITTNLSSANLLVSFGHDWLSSHPSLVEAQMLYAELRRGIRMKRAYIVQIEPRFSVTAAKADQWIPIKPGTEGFLALGLAQQLIANNTYSGEFSQDIYSFSLEEISKITGVSEKDIHLLADKFLNFQPAVAIGNRGTLFNQMALDNLNTVMGNTGKETIFKRLIKTEPQLPDKPFPVENNHLEPELLFIDRVNPLFLSPKPWSAFIEKAPFIATISSHMSETAMFSDLVLPCHTSLEQTHCSMHINSHGNITLNAAEPAVPPLYNTREPGEIFTMIKNSLSTTINGNDFNDSVNFWVKKLGAEKLPLPASQSHYSAAVYPKDKSYFPDVPSDDDLFPLFLYIYSPLSFYNGEGAHLPYLQSVAGPEMQEAWTTWADIYPDTAEKFGIKDGKNFMIESNKGKIKVKARFTSTAMPDVVSVPMGLGHTAYGRWAKDIGANPMELVEDINHTRVRIYV